MEDGQILPSGQIAQENVVERIRPELDHVPNQHIQMELLNVVENLRKLRNLI